MRSGLCGLVGVLLASGTAGAGPCDSSYSTNNYSTGGPPISLASWGQRIDWQ